MKVFIRILILSVIIFSSNIAKGQKKQVLTDSLKNVYSYEYKTSISILRDIKTRDFEKVYKMTPKKINKKEYKKTFKEILECLNVYNIPKESNTFLKEFYMVVPTFDGKSEQIIKTTTFEFVSPDDKLNGFDNTIRIDFTSNKEKRIGQKTHDYVLDEISFMSAKDEKRIFETAPAFPASPSSNDKKEQ